MNEDMTSTIKLLKTKLANLEVNYEEKFQEVERRETKEVRLESKLEDLINIQKQIITFNIGGEYFQIGKQIVLSTIYENILRDVLVNIEQMGRDIEDIQNVFIDRNPRSFLYISEI